MRSIPLALHYSSVLNQPLIERGLLIQLGLLLEGRDMRIAALL